MPDEMQGPERYEDRQREERKAAKTALLALVDQLRTAGVSEVIATFSGYGDEGSIEGVEVLDAQQQPVSLSKQFPNIEKTFDVLLSGGYEDNEGGSGVVTLDVENGRITVDTDWNVIETQNERYEV
ncbi:MAG TPA: hypothetical protein VMI06_04040 [Terriglobia bacterium]|nr:hypothetical protein [Terriglobia bacterium]